jgi:hypothetical protein
MPQSFANQNAWRDDLWLLTETELEVTPQGTVLTSIMGNKAVVGKDRIDKDTRFGYLAYGLYSSQFKH